MKNFGETTHDGLFYSFVKISVVDGSLEGIEIVLDVDIVNDLENFKKYINTDIFNAENITLDDITVTDVTDSIISFKNSSVDTSKERLLVYYIEDIKVETSIENIEKGDKILYLSYEGTLFIFVFN